MLFSTATILALVGFVSAAPTRRADGIQCIDAYHPKTGAYQDGGCGTIIQPGTSHVCLQTVWDTQEGSPLSM